MPSDLAEAQAARRQIFGIARNALNNDAIRSANTNAAASSIDNSDAAMHNAHPTQTTVSLRSQAEFFMGGVTPLGPQASECSICTEALDSDVINIMACGHNFHLVCVLRWFQSNNVRHTSCPNCRTELYEPASLIERATQTQVPLVRTNRVQYGQMSPGFSPTSSPYRPTFPGVSSPRFGMEPSTFSPHQPQNNHASLHFGASPPSYSPTSPGIAPLTPYSNGAPTSFGPASSLRSWASPAHSPTSYSRTSLRFGPTSPMYSPTSPVHFATGYSPTYRSSLDFLPQRATGPVYRPSSLARGQGRPRDFDEFEDLEDLDDVYEML